MSCSARQLIDTLRVYLHIDNKRGISLGISDLYNKQCNIEGAMKTTFLSLCKSTDLVLGYVTALLKPVVNSISTLFKPW